MSSSHLSTGRLTVRLGAIAANYRQFRQRAAPAEIAGVVKADAYGLGAAAVARTLVDAGCHTFFVARVEEGVALRPVVPFLHAGLLPPLVGRALPRHTACRE